MGGYDLITATLLVIPIFVFSIFSILFHRHRSQFSGSDTPPGNIGYPIIGESIEFLSAGRKGQPEKFFLDRMAEFGSKVFKTSFLGIHGAAFCGPAANKFLFSNENKLVVRWLPDSFHKLFPSTSVTSTIEESQKLRKLIIHFLKPEALRTHVETMDAVAQKHFASCWENKDQVFVIPLVKKFTFTVGFRLLLSYEDPEKLAKLEKPFHELANGITCIPLDFPGTTFNRAVKASAVVRKELSTVLERRKMDLADGLGSPNQDVLSHILSSTENSNNVENDTEVVDKIIGLLLGSHDTVSATFGLIMKFLVELPHVYERVYKEQMEIAESKAPGELLNWEDLTKMKYSWNVLRETLRLRSPDSAGFREVIKDFTYDGFLIRKGWKVSWHGFSTHRNPEYFPDPYKFEPSRFEGGGPPPFTFVPFGGGSRMCPGYEYARIEMLVLMHNLVKRFKWEIAYEADSAHPLSIPENGLPIRLLPPKTT